MRPSKSLRHPTAMKSLICAVLLALPLAGQNAGLGFLNHNHPVLDAHNCYPYEGQWTNRIDRALTAGFPVSIEQDMAWYVDPATGKGRAVVSHSADSKGPEPELRDYFFERVRPIVEAALKDGDRSRWPVIILHFDFKDVRPELLHAVWDVLGTYESWITTVPKTADPHHLEPFDRKPLLVVTEDSDAQAKVFYDDLPVGARLRLFGSAHPVKIPGSTSEERAHAAATMTPKQLLTEKPTNYRRWWNNSWAVVEEGGQRHAGEWSESKDRRLRSLVNYAHRQGFWIRFYTLDGFPQAEDQGWGQTYNFGSRDAVVPRWQAAWNAGVDFVATDQYEDLAALVRSQSAKRSK
jgi:hypothetical protein